MAQDDSFNSTPYVAEVPTRSDANLAVHQKSPAKDRIALVVAILFVVAISYLGYKYFTGTSDFDLPEETGEISATATQNLDDDSDESVGSIFDSTESPDNPDTDIAADSDIDVRTKPDAKYNNDADKTTGKIAPSEEYWHATDYEYGDIQLENGQYEVQSGDTLWEIAEAVCGNGADWTQILAANSGDIGTLSNGQQALIFPGQVLTIPVFG